MKIKLVFHDWLKGSETVYDEPEGIELTSGDFHHGTTFTGTIELDCDDCHAELAEAMRRGYKPVFYLAPPGKDAPA